MKKLLILLVLFASFFEPMSLRAQESAQDFQKRKAAIQYEEAKINAFITAEIQKPFPASALQTFQATTNETHEAHKAHHEVDHKIPLTNEQKAQALLNYKKHYYRVQYFKQHPEAADLYEPVKQTIEEQSTLNKTIAIPALQCPNGNFEQGFTNYTGLTNSSANNTGNYTSGNCNYIPASGLPAGMVPVALPRPNQIELTSNIPDPILNSAGITLMQTNNGSATAVRINGPTNSVTPGMWGNCGGDRVVDGIQRTFTTTSNLQTSVSLSYALVMEDPNHTNAQPFFVARLLDASGNELPGRICRIADSSNVFFNTEIGHLCNVNSNFGAIVYSDWICDQLTFPPGAGQTYTLQIFLADCAAGGHNAYAYVDDICINCGPNNNAWGWLTLDPTDTCDKTMQVCASYIPPQINGVTGTLIPSSPVLTILQNGVSTGITLTGATIDLINQTICFTVTPSDFGALTGGFDFQIDADFNLSGDTLTRTTTHTNPGLNNDYTTNPCDNCDCGSWSKTIISELTPMQSILIGSYPCNIGIAQSFEAGHTYQFYYNYNCNPTSKSCSPTYQVQHDINGTVTVTPSGNGLLISVTPNTNDCGIHTITVTPTCGDVVCPPCGLSFFVEGCHECVQPVHEKIYCDPVTGKPVVEFCLTNLTSQNRSFFGITMPAGVSVTNLTSPSDANLIYNSGMMVFETTSPIPPNGTACTFRFQIDGGIYKGQDLCIDLKSFTYYNSQGQFLNCCIDPTPLCLTIPDCEDDCADIVDASIRCINGQRVLTYKLKNNFYAQLDAYESFTVNGTPADYFFGFFSPPVLLGNTSPWISHVIPNSIASGSTYCFTNTVHMYYSNGHPCDSICYTDTVCLTVPYCGIQPHDTIKLPDTKHTLGKRLSNQNTSGLEGLSTDQQFLIYPNPVDHLINIKSQSVASRIRSVVLTDITGKTIIREEKDNLILHRLDVSKLPSGIYLLRINNEKNYKIVKQE